MTECRWVGRFALVDLYPYCGNKALTLPESRAQGNLGGMGGSFPAEHLPPPGPFSNCGVPFLMPDAARPRDNVVLEGQELPLPPGRWARAHFLGCSDVSSFRGGVALVYSGRPPVESRLGLSSIVSARVPLFGEKPGPVVPCLRNAAGDTPMEVRLWHQTLELDPDHELVALQFEDIPVLHVFALTLEAPAEGGGGGAKPPEGGGRGEDRHG